MNMLKRGLSLLLTLVMVLSMIPATHAHAAEVTSGYCGDPNVNEGKDVTWTLADGVLTISGTGKTNEYGYMGEMYGVPYGHDHLSTPWTETAVTSLVVEEGVTHILGLLSWGAYNLTDVSLPDSLKVIGHCSFEDCDNLTSITIPKNVTSIWSGAFWACENLTSITFTGDAPSINDYAFNNAVTATCYYPASANWPADKLKSYGGNLTWVPYGECNVHSFGSGDVCTVCGILGGSCGSDLTWTLDDEGNLVITGTGDLQDYNYGSSPFYKYADQITSVSLPEGLTSIGERAFDATFPNLDHIQIPTSVTLIRDCAFGSSYSQVQLKYAGTMEQWNDIYIAEFISYGQQYGAECSDGTIIFMGPCGGSNGLYDTVQYMLLGDGTLKITGSGAMKFYQHLNYASCFSGDDKITKVVIDEGVTSIAGYAFKNCENLTEVYIPASVTSISYNVFQGCTALTDVYYGSNEKNWNKMSISSDSNEPLAAATIHYTNPCIQGHDLQNLSFYCNDYRVIVAECGRCYEEVGTLSLSTPDAKCDPTKPYTAQVENTVSGFTGYTVTYCCEDGCIFAGSHTAYLTVGDCQAEATFNLEAVRLDVAGVTAQDRVYNGNDLATITGVKLSGVHEGADVAVDLTKLMAYLPVYTVGNQTRVTLQGVQLTGVHAKCYIINNSFDEVTIEGGVNITPAPLTLKAADRRVPLGTRDLSNVAYMEVVSGSVLGNDAVNYIEITGDTSKVTDSGELTISGAQIIERNTMDDVTFCYDITYQPGVLRVYCPGHEWIPADCQTPETCSVCGATEGEALGHDWLDADCETPKTCSVCGETEGEALGHDWVDADCEFPKHCNNCPATEGSALGHDWLDADCFDPKTCKVCGETEGKALGHDWLDADCQTPETCSVCGATEGGIGDHKWVDATCDAPKTCSVCGATEGEPLVHSWQEANCVSPERCVHCNDTRGEIDPYGHKFYNGNCKYCGVQGGQCGDQVYWTLVDGKLTVYGSGDMYHYQGVQSPWTSCRPRITQLEVIDGVTSVGDFAFNAFSNLTTVTLADSVTRVGRDAFAFCEKLQTVDLGDGLTEIGSYALRSCTSLQEATVPGSIRIWGTAIFQDCTALESATLEAGVSSVGEYLFLDCTALKTVTLPEGVRSIREGAFDGCSALEEIHIPDTTATIGNDAFNGCGRLTVLVIPESVTNIGYQAFDGCDKLTEVYYGGTEEVWNTMTGRPHVSYLHLSCTQPEGHWTEMTNPGSCVADSYTYDGCACGYERNIRNVRPGSNHDWIPADCDTPKTCILCGATEGGPLEHSQVCGVCTRCGIGLNLGYYQYTLDESAMTVTLTDYIGSGTDVHVAASYLLDGKEYRTLLEATSVFRGNTAITSVKIHDGVTVASNSMAEMFYGCASLKTADLTGLDTTGVTSLRRLFSECKKLTGVDVTGWDTSAVENMSYLFDYCSALTTITGYENWNTGSLWNISKAFNRTTSIEKVDLSKWDLSQITNSGWCFQICYAEEILLPDNLAVMSAGFLNHPAEFAGSTFRIPSGVKKIGYAHTIYDFGTDAFTAFEVPAQNGYYEAVDGILYSEDGTELLAIPRGKTFENGVFEVPNTVTFMGELSFSRNYNIETLVLPDHFIIEYVPLYDARYIIEDGHGGNDTGNLNSGTNLSIAIYCYTGITAYDVRETNTRYEAVDGVIYSEDMTTLVAVPARYAQHLNIPEGVTTWNKEAMWADHTGNSNLLSLLSSCTGVSIPSTLCEIDAEQLSMINALADRTSSAFTITVAEGNRTFHVNPTTGHLEAHTYSAVVTEPGCENAGYTTHTCSICEDSYKTDPVPAKEHDWADADCITPKTCKVCGETEGAPLDHNWTPADCNTPKTCSACGATEGTSTGHAWIDATCYSLKTCNNCGITVGEMLKHDWVDADCQQPKHCKNCTATEGSAPGHDWADADCENPKTCKRCGATEGTSIGHSWVEASCYNPRTCSVCGKIDSVSWGHDWQAVVDGTGEICNKCGATRGDVHSHTWLPATCSAPETCTSCGVTRGEKLPHTPVVDPAVDATCTTEGKSEGSHCSVCLQPLVVQQVIPLKAHTEVVDKAVEATCTETGLTEGKHCTVCGTVTQPQQIVTAAGHKDNDKNYICDVCGEDLCTDHQEEILPAKAATCTATGLTEGKKCARCGDILVAQQTVPVKAHTEVTDQAVEATCTATGLTEGKHCSVCGTVTATQQTVPTKAHVEVPDQAVAATCTATGKTAGSHCAVCGKVLKEQDKIPAMGHTPVVDAAVEATCSTEGLTAGAHCVVCDQVIKAQETIAKKDHTWKAATCSNPKTCTACGATSGYALGHDWASGNCTTPKTCKTCGAKDGGVVHAYEHQYDYKCDLCGTERIVDMTRPMVDMFRMYNPNTGEHFYTGSTEERDNLIAVGWQYEGVGFTFPLTTGKPVHRLFQPSTGEHLYTMDEAEKDKLMAEGWNYEGIAFNSGFENEVPQYRLWNPNATVGAYHFTASLEEKDNLLAAGWIYQGIGWYSLGA